MRPPSNSHFSPISTFLNSMSVPPTLQPVISRAYAPSTWRGKLFVAKKILGPQLLPNQPTPLLEQRSLQFLSQTLISAPTTVSRHVATIRALLPIFGTSLPSPTFLHSLRLLCLGQAKVNATRVVTKALPMSRKMLKAVLLKTTKEIGAILLLAFHTASRLDDIFKLRLPQALRKVDNSLLVFWDVSKTNQTAEKRADHQQVVRFRKSYIPLLTCTDILVNNPLTKIYNFLRSIVPHHDYVTMWQQANPSTKVRPRFSLHSLKRGKADELWMEVLKGTLTIPALLHKLKHKSLESSLAYTPRPNIAALAMQKHLNNPSTNLKGKSGRRSRKRSDL